MLVADEGVAVQRLLLIYINYNFCQDFQGHFQEHHEPLEVY